MNAQAAPDTGTVERRSKLSYAEFSEKYMYPNKPVIVTDAIGRWKAVTRWTPEFFRSEFSAMKFQVDGKGAGYEGQAAGKLEYTMPEFIDRVLASSDENPAPYFRNRVLSEEFPTLAPDIEPVPEYFLPNWLLDRFLVKRFRSVLNGYAIVELFIGGRGGTFPVLHYDHGGLHTFLMQIYGRKQYLIYPPEQTPYMYPQGEKPNLSMVDSVFAPDLTRFPLFAKAVPVDLVLERGETLFLPSGWWHTARMLTPSITLSLNTVNRSNWPALVNTKRSNPLVSLVSRVYLTGGGIWRAWRDRDWVTRGRHRTEAGARWYV